MALKHGAEGVLGVRTKAASGEAWCGRTLARVRARRGEEETPDGWGPHGSERGRRGDELGRWEVFWAAELGRRERKRREREKRLGAGFWVGQK